MQQSQGLGTEPINKLLFNQALPASVGIFVMSIYSIVDTIFIGRYVGTLGIAAITVVMPISFLISSFGMAIGVGGASIISRAFGSNDTDKANRTFGNMLTLTLGIVILLLITGYFLQDELLQLFGGNGEILAPAKEYFSVLLLGVPFLAFAMMSNSTIRAEGKARMAMFTLLIPAVLNIILDPIFIVYLDMGLAGAAWATSISYFTSAAYVGWFFLSGQSELKISLKNLVLKIPIVKEIFSIGIITLARQGTISLLTIVLNQSLYVYGGALAVAVFGIINRLSLFTIFPILGITQGFLPITGFNYGAKKWDRVLEVIRLAIRTSTAISIGIFLIVAFFAESLVQLFTTDVDLLNDAPRALTIVFGAIALVGVQLISSAYFQALGKAIPALLLTLMKQGFFLIPLVLTLPLYFGLDGIWYAFPISDICSAAIAYWYLNRTLNQTLRKDVADAEGIEKHLVEKG